MGFTTAGKNFMLDALGGVAVYASLHNGDPGESGINEISGGSPAYARKAITWNAATGGAMDDSNTPVFDVPAGASIQYAGLWSAASGGTFYCSDQVTTENFGAQGNYTLTDADLDLNT